MQITLAQSNVTFKHLLSLDGHALVVGRTVPLFTLSRSVEQSTQQHATNICFSVTSRLRAGEIAMSVLLMRRTVVTAPRRPDLVEPAKPKNDPVRNIRHRLQAPSLKLGQAQQFDQSRSHLTGKSLQPYLSASQRSARHLQVRRQPRRKRRKTSARYQLSDQLMTMAWVACMTRWEVKLTCRRWSRRQLCLTGCKDSRTSVG